MTTVDASPQITEASTLALVGSITIPSGPPVDIGQGKEKVSAEGWQKRAWAVWHALGEIRYPTAFLARQATRLKWQVTPPGADEPLDEEASKAYIEEATAGLGEDEASRLIVLNLEVAGEGYYVQDVLGDFHVYSILESDLDKKVKEAQKARRLSLRFYYPDPTDTTKAESAIRTALDPAEELLTLTALSRAQSRSRLAQAGILITPVEQSWASGDPFGQDLESAMMAGIEDERSPKAMVPIHVEMSAELIEKVRHVVFERPYDEKIPAKVEMAVKRIALAEDVPAELLLGIADVNHWTGWLISDETYNAHLGPYAARTGEVFAAAIEHLHPEMKGVTVTPDPSDILARRSTVRDALDAHKQKVVGGAFVRDAIGADDEDAPTPEDLALMDDTEGREPAVEENPGPPLAASLDAPSERMVGEAAGAVAMAIEHARAKVGAKLRTKLRNTPESDRIATVPNGLVATKCSERLSDIDCDGTILDALTPFLAWWEAKGYAMSPREARLVVASHVKATIDRTVVGVDDDLLRALGVR